MGFNVAVAVTFTVYKIACLLVGLSLSFMGYRLFIRSIRKRRKSKPHPKSEYSNDEINSQTQSKTASTLRIGNNKFINRVAPGIVYALFGAIILGTTIWKDIRFETLHYLPLQHALQPGVHDKKPE